MISYDMQNLIDAVNEEVEARQPKKRKVNKSVREFYGYKNDFIYDITERELTSEEWIEKQIDAFYDEI